MIGKKTIQRVSAEVLLWMKARKHRNRLRRIEKTRCNAAALCRGIDQRILQKIFSDRRLDEEWAEVVNELSSLMIPCQGEGVNSGDRRAIFYLIRHLRAKSILEIGTNIGASTVHAAAALRKNRGEGKENRHVLVTVDIQDVNNPQTKPWLGSDSAQSPEEMIASMGMLDCVRFVTAPSLEYFSRCTERYDLVFLDGDHSAHTVYQEIPAALRVLKQGGLILLHDYFPYLRPLWSDHRVSPGPFLAVQRLKSEHASIEILPLGELPWTTKLNSRVTSLALAIGQSDRR